MSAQTADTLSNTQVSNESHVDFRRFFLIVFSVVAGVILVEMTLTILIVNVIGYQDLPIRGEMIRDDKGEPYFEPYYSNLYFRFRVDENRREQPTETKLTRAGGLATGIFFYTVLNAPHWIWEMKFRNIGAMAAIPFIGIVFACFFLYANYLPNRLKPCDKAVAFCTTVGILHSLIVGALLFLIQLLGLIWPDAASLYEYPTVYYGQFTGALLPAAVIMFLTGIVYGTITGVLLYPFAGYVTAFNQELEKARKE